MYNRLISIGKNSSIFLFGAIGTGKSFLLRNRYSEFRSQNLEVRI